MLNIHSFLQGIKRRLSKAGTKCYQSYLMIAAYILAAVILVIGSDSFYSVSRKSAETYVKAQTIQGVFEETKGETANKANILQSDECKDKTLLLGYTQQGFAGKTIARMVESTIGEIEKEQRLEQEKLAREQKILDEQRKAEAKQAAIDKKEAEAKIKEEQKKKEQKAKEQKAKEQKEKDTRIIKLSDEQTQVLNRIVEAEATGEGMKGKILVANVILNRVKNSKFPNTVKEVVFQRNGNTVQFSPTKDGRYWSVQVTKQTKEAVKRALSGEDYSRGALYFSARSKADKRSMSWFDRNLTWLFKHGGHEFFK